MYIERVHNPNSPGAVLLRESYREGKKVHKLTLASLSKLPDEAVDGLRILLKGGRSVVTSQYLRYPFLPKTISLTKRIS